MARILIAEDDLDIQSILKDSLEEEFEGSQVDTASNGEEALVLARENSYSIILSDVKMPIKDGMDFLKALRDEEIYTPFMIITGHGDQHMAVDALRLGAIDFINKPFDMKRVFESVRAGIEMGERVLKVNQGLEDMRSKGKLSKQELDKLLKMNLAMANLNKRKAG
ncbi:MAG: hypothetical protein CL677_05305 [Bdellovibrionaceae bacterium]|nr:hypothetical protein [Pseudobdellovibrionaceae bacterium]|tara:strand:- start:19432 stop:19929 length:498 start_codon:yes stop_codon:yes gene_type:complete